MRAAVDVMGGDKAPGAILKGCWEAAPLLEGDDGVILVGCAETITRELAESGLSAEQKARYKIVGTTVRSVCCTPFSVSAWPRKSRPPGASWSVSDRRTDARPSGVK